MLHLPDMAELMRHEVIGREEFARTQEDRPVRRVTVEAAEPRQPEEPRGDEDPHAAKRNGPRVQIEPVEPRLRARERVTLLGVHETTL